MNIPKRTVIRHLRAAPVLLLVAMSCLLAQGHRTALCATAYAMARFNLGGVPVPERDIEEIISAYRHTSIEALRQSMPQVADSKRRELIVQNLTTEIANLRLSDAEVTDKLRTILAPVLAFYRRDQVYALVVIRNRVPIMMSDSGSVLMVSTGLIQSAGSDDMLLGYVAHEIGHERFLNYSWRAKVYLKLAQGDQQPGAVVFVRKFSEIAALIELQCDGFAALSLAALGYNPMAYVESLEQQSRDYPGYSDGFHPEPSARRRVVVSVVPESALRIRVRRSQALKELQELLAK